MAIPLNPLLSKTKCVCMIQTISLFQMIGFLKHLNVPFYY